MSAKVTQETRDDDDDFTYRDDFTARKGGWANSKNSCTKATVVKMEELKQQGRSGCSLAGNDLFCVPHRPRVGL